MNVEMHGAHVTPARWPHPATQDVAALLLDCDVTRTRRSGPGGQHRNRVESAVVIKHRPSGIIAEGSERRSQEQNRLVAIDRLRVKLAVEHRTEVDPMTGPSALWRSRCKGGRIVLSLQHSDYPAMLAEALDVLAAHGMDVRSTAERLGCSGTQLVNLIKSAPAAFDRLNRFRVKNSLPALK